VEENMQYLFGFNFIFFTLKKNSEINIPHKGKEKQTQE
jgi:hypothetical protein